MQRVPQISEALWNALGEPAQRLTVLVELYPQDALPTSQGFSPDDAILRVANKTISFLGHDYARKLETPGRVNRTITEKFNTVSLSLNNHPDPIGSNNRPMAAFCLSNDLEGMFMVIRLVSRAVTATTLADSFVVFTGRCEKIFDADSDNVVISAKQYIGSVDQEIPWRTLDAEDEDGREISDPLFEGFPYKNINVTVQRSEEHTS